MNNDRAERLSRAMQRAGYQALICREPQNVLMLTGYLPVLGNTFCLVSLDQHGAPEIRLAVPKAETDLLPSNTAVEVQTFTEETLKQIGTTLEAVREPLSGLLRSASLNSTATIGYEGGHAPIAPAYTQVGVAGPATLDMLRELLPQATFHDATQVIDEVAAIKTDAEIEHIKRSASVATAGFEAVRGAVQVGAPEADVHATMLAAITRAGYAVAETGRVLAYVHVMSGPRSADAYKAYNLTSNRRLERGDPVLVQMEVGVDGYWAELTRTFFVGDISDEWRHIHEACVQAQDEALATIRDGAPARHADEAARKVLQTAGWGDAFKHGLGHGVGFQAINHGAAPILHPVSKAVLHTGMVHNAEPAVYLDGKGGLRLNDDIAVRHDGAERLSESLPRALDWLVTAG